MFGNNGLAALCPLLVLSLALGCTDTEGEVPSSTVYCTQASDCPGIDTVCKIRTCVANSCGMSTAIDEATLPDDGESCTEEQCLAGELLHLPKRDGVPCENGLSCKAGVCGGCETSSDCPSTSNECLVRSCAAGRCGFDSLPEGTMLSDTSVHDCQKRQCGSAGTVESVADDADVPYPDRLTCTEGVCTDGVPSRRLTCSKSELCVPWSDCVARPTISSCYSSPGSYTAAAGTTMNIYGHLELMEEWKHDGQVPGVSGRLCYSAEPFVAPVDFNSLACVDAVYETRWYGVVVYKASLAFPVAGTYYHTFVFSSDEGETWTICKTGASSYKATILETSQACAPSKVVISQIYSRSYSNLPVPPYKNDFVELHNRSLQIVEIGGWAIQFSPGALWDKVTIPRREFIAPGGYYLIPLAGGKFGAELPVNRFFGSMELLGLGSVALTRDDILLSGQCPSSGAIVDLVGFGPGSSCFEGVLPTMNLIGGDLSLQRDGDGCTDTDSNSEDFSLLAPSPRYFGTEPVSCGCQ